MKTALSFARRYLVARKSTNAINVISAISVLGMLIGSTALIIVLSVFNGFEDLVISLYNSFNPDIKITAQEGKVFTMDSAKYHQLQNMEDIQLMSLVIEENALLKYNDKQFIATIKGVDDQFFELTDMDSMVIRGHLKLEEDGRDFAVLGAGIELALSVNMGDPFSSIQVFMPKRGRKTRLNPSDAFNRSNIYPAGVFSIQKELDDTYVIVPLSFARRLLNYYNNEVGAIEIQLASEADVQGNIAKIKDILGNGYNLQSRYEQNQFLYKIMQTEKLAAYLILTFILIIASFNIIGSLSMIVIEKSKDISVLKVLGATKPMIRNIFLFQGLLMALVGSCVGAFLAFLICWAQIKFKLLKMDGLFVVDAYPVKMESVDFLIVVVTVLLIGLASAWIPSIRAAEQAMAFKEN